MPLYKNAAEVAVDGLEEASATVADGIERDREAQV